MTGSVIQVTGMMNFEDGLRTEVLQQSPIGLLIHIVAAMPWSLIWQGHGDWPPNKRSVNQGIPSKTG